MHPSGKSGNSSLASAFLTSSPTSLKALRFATSHGPGLVLNCPLPYTSRASADPVQGAGAEFTESNSSPRPVWGLASPGFDDGTPLSMSLGGPTAASSGGTWGSSKSISTWYPRGPPPPSPPSWADRAPSLSGRSSSSSSTQTSGSSGGAPPNAWRRRRRRSLYALAVVPTDALETAMRTRKGRVEGSAAPPPPRMYHPSFPAKLLSPSAPPSPCTIDSQSLGTRSAV